MSAVLPVPNPEPAPALEPQLDRASSSATSISAGPIPANPAGEWARHAGKGRLLIIAFTVGGATAAWLSGVLMVPVYRAESRIEIRPTGETPPTPEDSFVATQAQLLTSASLRRQAVARLQQEQPGILYRSEDRLAGLRHEPLATYLPPVVTAPTIPAEVEVTTYGSARVLALQVRSTDPSYSAHFANALASEYMALDGNPAAGPTAASSDPWLEASARFVDRAEIPNSPVNPPGRTRALWGALAGLAVGFAAVASRGSEQASRVSGPGDIRARLNMRELGAIPWAGSVPDPIPGNPITGNALWDAAFGRQTNRRIAPAETAVWKDEASLLAEAFRSATTSLLLVKERSSRPQVITVTSAHRGEGKTTAVLNLGAALADLSLKVLVVDADLRTPRLHQILGLPNSWGLSDLLQERIPLRDVPVEALVRTCSIPNLSIVCSGPPTLNVASLLYSDRMEELMGRFRREFDVILIDTPPSLMLSDARLAARLSDTVVIIIKAGETTDAEAGQLRQRLAEDGIPLAGALLNGWRCHETPEGERMAGVRHV